MKPHQEPVSRDSAQRYERSRTVARKYMKEQVLSTDAWQWAVWFLYNGQQCGTRCPYQPDRCYVGSDTCVDCPSCEGIQIVTGHSGRVFCKQRKEELQPLPEVYFMPEGPDRLEQPGSLPDDLCPW